MIKQALGEEHAQRTPVSSTKGATGHCFGAAGAIEAVFTTLAVRDRKLPPTINYEAEDPECDLDYIAERVARRARLAASRSRTRSASADTTRCLVIRAFTSRFGAANLEFATITVQPRTLSCAGSVVRQDNYVWRVRRVDIGGRTVEIPVRVSRRARKLSIHVDALRNVEIVVPPRTTQDEIDRCCSSIAPGSSAQLAKPPKHVPPRPAARRRRVDRRARAAGCRRCPSLDEWYREQARVEIARVVAREAQRLGVTYTRITIRDQLTRWGSCSKARRAVVQLAPDRSRRRRSSPTSSCTSSAIACDHDHSRRVLGSSSRAARPTYEEERDWLAEHGPELLAYRVPKRRVA